MKLRPNRRRLLIMVGVIFASFAGTLVVGAARDGHEVKHSGRHEVARLTEKMKAVCVGRFLIDIPVDVQVELGRASIDGINVAAFDESSEEFERRLLDRMAQITNTPDRLGGNKNLESTRVVNTASGLVGKIFVHGRTVSEGTRAKGLELERYRYEGIAVEAQVHGNGTSIELISENRDLKWTDDISNLANKLVANPENRIPAESGFCIDRAYVRDPLRADQGEAIMMAATSLEHPDVKFALFLSAGLEPNRQGLLERSRAADALLTSEQAMRMKTLRATSREINGLNGEELVQSFFEENGATVHSFWWELIGSENSVFTPHILFKMDTGYGEHGPLHSSLSAGEAAALWDKVLSSFRPRAGTRSISVPRPTNGPANSERSGKPTARRQ
ncbi:MAG: T6SS immunity protein Tli4 family protein [Pseudomonadota bacterium]